MGNEGLSSGEDFGRDFEAQPTASEEESASVAPTSEHAPEVSSAAPENSTAPITESPDKESGVIDVSSAIENAFLGKGDSMNAPDMEEGMKGLMERNGKD